MTEIQMLNIMAATIYAAGYRCLDSYHGTHEWTISMADAVTHAYELRRAEVRQSGREHAPPS